MTHVRDRNTANANRSELGSILNEQMAAAAVVAAATPLTLVQQCQHCHLTIAADLL